MGTHQEKINEKSSVEQARARRHALAEAIGREKNEERKRELQADLDELESAYEEGELEEIQS